VAAASRASPGKSGVLQGLQEAGVDIVNCDVVGTSASAFVGAKLLAEGSIDGLYKAQLSDPVDREQARLRRVFGPVVVGAIRLSRRPR
jgi:predicted acylesterase/phospholipase RssA